MRNILLFGLALVSAASATFEMTKGYHAKIGVPLAEKIRLHEEGLKLENNADTRIIGGALAPNGAYPYFAGLLISFWHTANNSVCGSSLLTAKRLVTAAHCWFDGESQASQFTVILGTNFLYRDGTRINTNQVFMHPQFSPVSYNNDIAMIYLPIRVWFSMTIQPIDIPNPFELWDTFVGQWATAVGFGKTNDAQEYASSVLSHVALQVISVAQCQAFYSIYGSDYVIQSTLCASGAGGVGICEGDSGGPFALNYNGRPVLIGISSFAIKNNCQRGFPVGFTRVSSFRDFIMHHL